MLKRLGELDNCDGELANVSTVVSDQGQLEQV